MSVRATSCCFTAAKGPEPRPVTVVSYLGYEQTTAVEEAETLGLKVTVKHVYSDALAGTVVEQSIAQDTVVTTGAEIVLTVSDGPDPSVSGTEGIPRGGVRGRIKKALSGFYYVDTGEGS